jgi:glycosyltransferase involved in cell wall biosynthesis
MPLERTVAVIIPTKNRPVLLDEAIASALRQSHPPKEVIVIDDGSSTPLSEANLRLRHGAKVRVLQNGQSFGLAFSRNLGVEQCHSDYFIHLDDDDLLSPNTIECCLDAVRNHPDIPVWFINAVGFGASSQNFDDAQATGLALVCESAHGINIGPNIVVFERRLFPALLRRVPIAFQRIFTTPDNWTIISRLRWRAYMDQIEVTDEIQAKRMIKGTLRDSEWARFAAAACKATGLIRTPLYLQRCEGQGYSSNPANIERHLVQNEAILRQMLRATRTLTELADWRSKIRHQCAQSSFDLAYHYAKSGDRGQSFRLLLSAAWQFPALKHLKLAARLCLPLNSR